MVSRDTAMRRILAILAYAHPDARMIEVDIVDGQYRCIVDGQIVPRPPKEAYGG